MNWDAVGAIAELVGSIAVVATLLFLLGQIRTNSVMIQNASAQDSANAVSEWSRQLTSNPDLYRIYRQGLHDDTSLSREDRGLFDLVLFQAFYNWAGIFVQYRNGGLDEMRWESEMRVFASNFDKPGGRASWERMKHMLATDFQREVEARLNPGANDEAGAAQQATVIED